MKNTAKIISLILALVMMLSVVGPCIACAADTARTPVVRVPGFMAGGCDLYIDKDDPDKGLAWPPSSDSILNAVKKSVPALTKYMFDRDADKLCDVVDPLIAEMFAPAMLDENGDPKGNSGVIFEYPEEITEDTDLYFKYDWRLDPLEIASQLNDFIDYVIEKTGSPKVSINCESCGGVVTLSYIALYGHSKLKTVIFNSTAIFGVNYAGPLFSGKMKLSGEAIVKYMRLAFNENDAEKLLNSIFAILGKAGLLDFVCNIGNKLLDELSPRAVPEVIAPLFSGWLTIWAMNADEYIDSSMKYIFEDSYKNDGSHDGLKAKVERYNELVRSRKTELLTELNNDVNVYVIATYGWSSIPITPDYNRLGDGTIDLASASFGATCAEYGSVLDVEPSEFVSPDKCCDVSTCLFPEQTWVIKGLVHCEKTDGIRDMFDTLLEYDGQATVDTFAQYPRFMEKAGEDIVAQKQSTDENKITFLDKIKQFFERMIGFIKGLFVK